MVRQLKKPAFITTALLMIILCASLLGTVSAQTYVPGVKYGDTFKYRYELSVNVTGSDQVSVPSPFDALVEQAETIDNIQVTVTGISDSKVLANTITQYKTGTQQEYAGTSDVSSGTGTLAQFFIAANLAANNPLHMNSQDTLNGTTPRTYASGNTRELNYQNVTLETTISPDQLTRYNITVPLTQINTQESYWDQQTGALAQLTYRMTTTSTQVNATLTLSLNLVESNVFAVPEYPAVIGLLLVFVIPTLVAITLRKRQLK
jgi:hypothetical protein